MITFTGVWVPGGDHSAWPRMPSTDLSGPKASSSKLTRIPTAAMIKVMRRFRITEGGVSGRSYTRTPGACAGSAGGTGWDAAGR